MTAKNLLKSLLGAVAGIALTTGAFAADPVPEDRLYRQEHRQPVLRLHHRRLRRRLQEGRLRLQVRRAGDRRGDVANSVIEAQIQRGVNVIGIAPNSPDALNKVFDEARAKGIFVLDCQRRHHRKRKPSRRTILPTNFDKVGADQVEMVGSLIGYEGEVAILSATTEAPDQNKWIVGMKEAFAKDPKFAKMKLVAVVYGDDQPEKSTTEMEALLSNYPNLKGVIAPTTVGVAAAAQVIQSRKLADKVHVTGLGLPSEMRPFIKDGTVRLFSFGRLIMKAGCRSTSPRACSTKRSRTRSAPLSTCQPSARRRSTRAIRSTPRLRSPRSTRRTSTTITSERRGEAAQASPFLRPRSLGFLGDDPHA